MTQEWLPEGFEIKDLDAPARMARRVHQRVAVHRRRVRVLQGVTALAALAVLLGVAPLLWRSHGISAPSQAPLQTARVEPPPAWSQETPQGVVPVSPALSPSPIPNSQSAIRNASPEVTLAKAGKGVELAWTGNPKDEYIVYRCTSPKFDQCSVAGVVQGTQWKDSGSDLAPVVFYRVEPKA